MAADAWMLEDLRKRVDAAHGRLTATARIAHRPSHSGFRRNTASTMASPANPAARAKLTEEPPVRSAVASAAAGPMIWPMPKIKVMVAPAAATIE